MEPDLKDKLEAMWALDTVVSTLKTASEKIAGLPIRNSVTTTHRLAQEAIVSLWQEIIQDRRVTVVAGNSSNWYLPELIRGENLQRVWRRMTPAEWQELPHEKARTGELIEYISRPWLRTADRALQQGGLSVLVQTNGGKHLIQVFNINSIAASAHSTVGQ